MEEFDDSLDGDEEFTGPIIMERNVNLQVTNQLISSLRNQGGNREGENPPVSRSTLMQTGPFDPTISHQSGYSPQTGNGFTWSGVQQSTGSPSMAGSSPYKRSGPDGSPAFNQSSGFLPTVPDNESVVFRPVRQLDFSALDETGSRIEYVNTETHSQVIDGGQYHMFEQRQEVYGSHDLTEDSREQSPANDFYALKTSPAESVGSGELDSRVIFSPLRGNEDHYAVAVDEDYSHTYHQQNQQNVSSLQSQGVVVKKSVVQTVHSSEYPRQNSPQRQAENSKYTTSSQVQHVQGNTNHDSDGDFVSPRVSQDYSNKSSPVSVSSPSKRVVSISIPQATSVPSPQYEFSPDQGRSNDNTNLQHVDHNQETYQDDSSVAVNAAWEIPVTEKDRNLAHISKDVKLSQRPIGQRKPFVSSVKSDIDSYQPKVQTNFDTSRKETNIPRPKTKGADVRSQVEQRTLGKGEPSQRPVTQGQGQRGGPDEQRQPAAGDRKLAGPIPSHAESRIQARKNLSASNDKLSKPGVPGRQEPPQNVGSGRSQNPYQRGQGQPSKGQGAREFHEAARQNAKHQERSPVHPAANVVTQVQQYGSEREEKRASHLDKTGHASEDVKGMEEVRSQLQSMLKFSADNHQDSHRFHQSEQFMDVQEEHFQYTMDYSAMGGKEDVSDLLENFPSFTSHMWTDTSNLNRSDASLQAENQRLREVLEKERYRRKHCEQYIQRLNVKLLETQQQLAVAISTDKRKDIMIEQLDKQLAKVVEGWKKRDESKEEMLNEIREEKKKVEEKLGKQQEMIENFEKDMAQALDQLRKEKEEASMEIEQLKLQVSEAERAKSHAVEMYEAEVEKTQLVKQEWDHMKETRDHSEKKIQQLQDRVRKEQDEWFKREQELLQKIEEVSENNQKVLQQERDKAEEACMKSREIEERLHTTQTEIRKRDMELDAAIREKESLKVEMGIMEAKFESSQRTLEAELHAHMEKEIAEQIADVHKRMEESENELRASHRQQIKDLNQRYARDMEKNMSKFHEDQKNREEEYRKLTLEYEKKLQEQRSEIATLQSTKQKLESQRSEILMKLQYMMQSQWNEAVQLLASTPQRKNMHGSSFTTQGSGVDNITFGGVSQAGFPVTSSPGRESTASAQPHLEPPNISDLTTSLHMQQFLQSLSQPLSFGLTSAPTTSESRQHDMSSSQHTTQTSHLDVHMTVESQKPKLSHVPEETSHPQDDSMEITDHHVHQWLQSSQGTVRGSENYSYHESNQSQHHRQTKAQEVEEHFIYTDGSQEFVPSFETDNVPTSGQATAVPIRPPQHGNSQFSRHGGVGHSSKDSRCINDISIETVQSANQPVIQHRMPESYVSQSYAQRSPGHSPPTKQSRSHPIREQFTMEDHHETDVLRETVRLNADYRTISQKLEQHESRQGELQHYIHMLLNKPPGDPVHPPDHEENASFASNEHTEELDLNDTAQAAQLQRELHRIQELRDKQAKTQTSEKEAKEMSSSQKSSSSDSSNKVLQPEQLADIAKLLHQQRVHWDTSHDSESNPPIDEAQLLQLVHVMKAMQSRNPQAVTHPHVGPDGRKQAMPHSPKSLSPKHNREIAKVKRNLKEQLAGPPEGSGKGEKSVQKGQPPPQQQKKPDRKVAPSAKSAQSKNKSAWK